MLELGGGLGIGIGLSDDAVGFTPAQLPGYLYDFDSRYLVNLLPNVHNWGDVVSGGTIMGTQGTTALQPTYNATDAAYGGQPTLQFASASTQYLALNHLFPAQPSTVLVVGESTSGTGLQRFFGDNGSDTSILIGTGSSFPWTMAVNPTALSSSNSTQGSPLAFAGLFNGNTSTLYINSSAAAAASGAVGTSSPSGSQFIGATGAGSQCVNGKIARLIVCTGLLTQSQISQVFAYFAQLYENTWS